MICSGGRFIYGMAIADCIRSCVCECVCVQRGVVASPDGSNGTTGSVCACVGANGVLAGHIGNLIIIIIRLSSLLGARPEGGRSVYEGNADVGTNLRSKLDDYAFELREEC